MNKKEIIEKLKELGVEANPDDLKKNLETALAVAEKNAKAPKEEAKPEVPKAEAPKEAKASGKITTADLINFGPIEKGQKDIRVTLAEVKELRDQGVLCGYDPVSGVARIKG